VPFYRRPDGCRLYHELHGSPDGEPLVLLEGMGGDIPGWRRNIPRLARRLRVVAFDFRGNGRSDPPPGPVSISMLAQDTQGLLDHLGIDRAHVYGQSMGGMVGQLLAVEQPHRLRSLILGCSHPGGGHTIRTPARIPKDRPWEALYSPGFAEEHPEHVAEDLRAGIPQTPAIRRRQWEAVRSFDLFDRLPEIRIPTLIIHGTDDRLVHPDNARVLAERIPGSQLVLLERAGHVYHSEQPEAADGAVLEFIASLRGE
jgi:pimeloyl-ACP methyl ester carboxylesterase